MSFLSDMFGKGKKKQELNIPITELPSSSSEKDGTEVRMLFSPLERADAGEELPSVAFQKPAERYD